MKRKSVRMEEYDYSEPGAYFITICTYKKMPLFGMLANEAVRFSEVGAMTDRLWQDIPRHFRDTEIGQYVIMPDHLHGIIVINETGAERIGVLLNDGKGTAPTINLGVILNDGRGTTPTKNFRVIANDGRGTALEDIKGNVQNKVFLCNESPGDLGVILNDGRGTACRAPTEELGDSPRGDGPNSFWGSRAPAEEMKSSRIESRAPTMERFQHPVKGSIPTIIRSYKSAVSREFHKLFPDQSIWQRGYYEHVIQNEKEWGMIHDYIDANPMNWDQDKIGKHEWMQTKIG